jgi:hypothetical protein
MNGSELNGRDIAQAVSLRPLTAEDRIRARVSPYGICSRQSSNETSFSLVLRFCLSISFHRRSPNSYHLGMNNISGSGSSSEM